MNVEHRTSNTEHPTAPMSPAFCGRTVAGILTRHGVPRANAERWAELLVETSLLGYDSHGIRLVGEYVKHLAAGGMDPVAEPEIVGGRGAFAVVDAHHGLGHLAADYAVSAAIERAAEHGVGCVTVRDCNHIGACGLYARRMALSDMIGICTTVAGPGMAPWGGREKLLGSNPLAVGAPIDGKPPFLFDAATSLVAMQKIRVAEARGEAIPDTWALDVDGNPTTDPAAALAGTLAPAAGHKGFGLALAVEILSSCLSGGVPAIDIPSWIQQKARPIDASLTVIAIDIAASGSVDDFKRRLRERVDALTASARRPGVDRIWYPGEREGETCEHRSRDGIPVDQEVLAVFREFGGD